MNRRLAYPILALAVATLVGVTTLKGTKHVGDKTPEGVVVATGRLVKAIGPTAQIDAAIVDAAITPDKQFAILKTSRGLAVIKTATGELTTQSPISEGTSLTGLAISPDGATVACSTATHSVWLFPYKAGTLGTPTKITLPTPAVGGEPYPCGLAYLNQKTLAVASNRGNELLIADLGTAKVTRRIPVDTAPYAVLVEDADHVLVSCWAAPSQQGAPTAVSSGTPVEIDKRGIAVEGSLVRVNISTGTVDDRVTLPLQPTEILEDGPRIYVACANGDRIALINKDPLALNGAIVTPAEQDSGPDSLAIDKDKNRLYAAFGGLDRVGVFTLDRLKPLGLLQTAWYPTAVRMVNHGLLVATAKGYGSLSGKAGDRNATQITGTVSFDPNPRPSKMATISAPELRPRDGMQPVPVPDRTGEPSVFKHVVYVIKENRTYDQLLGDMPEGDGDPKLTTFGAKITPNHHAIARQFVLLDNYYCNGVISSDGHAWATEGNATGYYERARGGWTRSYPFGDDPLATSYTGYIWDDVLDHGLTVRNFGEFDYATTVPELTPHEIYERFIKGEPIKTAQNIGVERIRAVSEPDYPGWNLAIPDVLRADRFVKRLHELEAKDEMANLTLVYLPEDHTAGGAKGYPSPRAEVADNDLGLGRVVDAISHSKFWANTVIFVEEDDPQSGYDHIDGHRSECLVVSPYTRRGVVVSQFYNQASVLHTMERILGIPPMNLNDATATLMTECFQPTPDLTPYTAQPNQIPLDEPSAPIQKVTLRLDRPDMNDDDLMNRRLWALSKTNLPYPTQWAGPHGRGLAKKGLKLDRGAVSTKDRD